MDLKFYHKGVPVLNKGLQEKIKKDSKRCWWHDKPDEFFTGYVDCQGICYDVCSFGAWERVKKREIAEKEYEENFLTIKNTINESIDIIKCFIISLSEISEIKSAIRSIKKKIENGYVIQDTKIRGGKKTRRYKKDNRRFLTEKEIFDLKKEEDTLTNLEVTLSKKIEIEKMLEKVYRNMYFITESQMHAYNNRFEWHETVGLYRDYTNQLNNLKLRLNHFTFNCLKESYEIQKKELDLTLDDITIFQETSDKILERIEEDKRIEEMMTVKRERKVTKKAKFFIDENGKRVELDQNTEQVVIHR